MAFDFDRLVENHFKEKRNIFGFESIVSLIEEALDLAPLSEESEKSERNMRAVRFPIQFPTEINVGQSPGSEDREIFHLWMSKISGETIGDKVKAINAFIKDPQFASVQEALSYLMFLNVFAFVLKQFNASVAGFLWEAFLPGLVGGDSQQVPTEKGDITDVELKGVRYSLKVLRPEGEVGGSFYDLVKHFAENPDKPMVYLIIKKHDDDTRMVFWEFTISAETFFDFIGHPARVVEDEPAGAEVKTYQVTQPGFTRASLTRELEGIMPGASKEGVKWKIVSMDYAEGARTDEPVVGGATRIKHEDKSKPSEENPVVLNIRFEKKKTRIGLPGGKDPLVSNAEKLWGDANEYEYWYNLYIKSQQLGKMKEFFTAVQKGTRDHKPAPGIAPNAQQFEINWNYAEDLAKSRGLVQDLGEIDISEKALNASFAVGSDIIGKSLTKLFNAVTDLSDNVAKFFLIDCGTGEALKTCSPEDDAQRTAAGFSAQKNVVDISEVVNQEIIPAIGPASE